jgi:hypothetical protein
VVSAFTMVASLNATEARLRFFSVFVILGGCGCRVVRFAIVLRCSAEGVDQKILAAQTSGT